MKYRAIVKQSGGWWIGWLVDLPGVNAQERTREELLASLRIGAEDMLETEVPCAPGATMAIVEVPDREWAVAEQPTAYGAGAGERRRHRLGGHGALAVRGVYDGEVARPLEEVDMPADAAVIITFLQPQKQRSTADAERREALAALDGAWQGEPLVRPPQGEYPKREALR